MLHSFYYYVCYALLCLLHHQQQAASVTVTLDGASTSEWATRDEYQRLLESAALSSASGSARDPSAGPGAAGASLAATAAAAAKVAASGANGAGGGADATGGSSSGADGVLATEPVAQPELTGLAPGERFELALDGLEQLERERERLIGVANVALAQQFDELKLQHQQRQQDLTSLGVIGNSPSRGELAGGTHKTLADLVPIGDQDLGEQTNNNNPTHSALGRLRERESAEKHYCGQQLIDVLDLVCQGRYYGGDFEPQTVNPIVKSRRSAGNHADSQTHHATRRRKLRTFEDNVPLQPGKSENTASSYNKLATISDGDINRPRLPSTATRNSGEEDDDTVRMARQRINFNEEDNHDSSYDNINNNNNFNVRAIDKSQMDHRSNRANRHSRMALYRRIRGANAECCVRPCRLEDLKPYCKQ